jgi:hypothetical protein
LEFLTLKSFLTYLPLKQRGANRPPPIGKRVNNHQASQILICGDFSHTSEKTTLQIGEQSLAKIKKNF